MSNQFSKNIFLNCPFDKDYRALMLGIVFTIRFFGYVPRLALESADSADTRIAKITKIIKESKFGIHDLSRLKSKTIDEYHRMNMPFELGIDYGCKKMFRGVLANKKILILEKEQHRFRFAISDLSGCDIKSHQNETIDAIGAVRDWLVTEELGRGKSKFTVWSTYNEFNAYLYDEVVEKDGHPSIDEVQVSEIIHHMNEWFDKNVTKP